MDDSPQDRLINKLAKITIQTEFVLDGKVLEITPDHHLIETSNNNGKVKVMEIRNNRVVKIEPKKMEVYHSRC
jgi:hypothetical protein